MPEGMVALTRDVSPSMADCELTFAPRLEIDIERARAQHRDYEQCLARLGCRIIQLPPEPRLPDSVFIEDTAVVFDEIAVIARPGARSRRAETQVVARDLALHRRVTHIRPPATLDGGDVLAVGREVFVGVSTRTNHVGFEQMRSLLMPLGYRVTGVPVLGALHLKSAVTLVAGTILLINRNWTDASAFESAFTDGVERVGPGSRVGVEFIEVAPGEPHAANALLIGDAVVYPAGYPLTKRRLEEHGITVVSVDISELAKAEGGVTCCSLVFRDQDVCDFS